MNVLFFQEPSILSIEIPDSIQLGCKETKMDTLSYQKGKTKGRPCERPRVFVLKFLVPCSLFPDTGSRIPCLLAYFSTTIRVV